MRPFHDRGRLKELLRNRSYARMGGFVNGLGGGGERRVGQLKKLTVGGEKKQNGIAGHVNELHDRTLENRVKRLKGNAFRQSFGR